MRHVSKAIVRNSDRFGVAVGGLILFALAALSWALAQEHIAGRGVICGAGGIPHCGWCYGAAGFALAGLAAFALAFGPAAALRKLGLLEIKVP